MKTRERHKKVLEDTLGPTDEDIKAWAFHNMLRRMTDQDYDLYCLTKFEGKSESEIKELIRQEILKGYGP